MTICTFDKAQYLLHEPIRIRIARAERPLEVKVFCLEQEVPCHVTETPNGIEITQLPLGAYGITISTETWTWEGAFDIVEDHREVTRYGFLADFSPADVDTDDVAWMKDLHLNAVQFYDWMYRHDQLLPPTKQYDDPLGRPMDLQAVKDKIDACKEYGIRPFAYGAIYAATENTYKEHPQWAMYTMDGQPMTFAGWLYYMNVAEQNGWSDHIVEEYRKAVKLGFSGIHMDTYGFPKKVWDCNGQPVELSNDFAKLIDRADAAVREEDNANGVIFNAVNNWPMEAVARSNQDAVYIEVWPPHDTYYDLYTLIREARICSGKNVVLAAYMKPFQNSAPANAENALLLTWATICASGGTQLVFGEKMSLLMDSYYVNYASVSDSFYSAVQKNCDFLVRYAALLYNDDGTDITRTASGGINEDICFHSEQCSFSADGRADTVWTIIRETNQRTTIHLINLCGNDNLWDTAKNTPQDTGTIQIQLRLDRPVKGFYGASPDWASLQAVELDYTFKATDQGRIYTVNIPSVQYWTAIWVQLEG